jgi:hypothetical protein
MKTSTNLVKLPVALSFDVVAPVSAIVLRPATASAEATADCMKLLRVKYEDMHIPPMTKSHPHAAKIRDF